MKFDVKSLIEQVVKEELVKLKEKNSGLAEAKPFKVNPKYNVFAIEKATNKIVNGWDLDPKDKENLRDYIKKTSPYVKMDLKDMDYKPSEVDVVSVATAKSKGLDPFNWDSWKKKVDESLQELSPATKNAATVKAYLDSHVSDNPIIAQKRGQQYKILKAHIDPEVKRLADSIAPLIGEDVEVEFDKMVFNENPKENVFLAVFFDTKNSDLTKWVTVSVVGNKGYIQGSVPPKVYEKLGSLIKKIKEKETGGVDEVTIVPTSGGKPMNPAEYAAAKASSAMTGDTLKLVDKGKVTQMKEEAPLNEKKDDKENVEAEAPVEDMPAPSEDSISDILSKHIADAIDAAAKCIQDSQDKKYENTLGKVVKHLTSAQSSLEAVKAHETKLSEVAAKETEKATNKHEKALRGALKAHLKNPQHIDQVVKTYNKVLKNSVGKDPKKLAEVIVAHALKEGFNVK